MKSFYANIETKERKQVKELFDAFFEEFSPENSIYIKGNFVSIEMDKSKIPQGIINKIGQCIEKGEVEFCYNKKIEKTQDTQNNVEVKVHGLKDIKIPESTKCSESINYARMLEDLEYAKISESSKRTEIIESTKNTKNHEKAERTEKTELSRKAEIPEKVEKAKKTEIDKNPKRPGNLKDSEKCKSSEKNNVSEEKAIRLKPFPEIPELKVIFENTKSLDEDVEELAKWLGTEKIKNVLKLMLMTIQEDENLTWVKINEIVRLKGLSNDHCKNLISKKIKKYELNMTIMQFLRSILCGRNIDDRQIDVIHTENHRLKNIAQIPEISKIISEASSFDEEANKIAIWLELSESNQELFINILKAGTVVDKISWSLLGQELRRRGYKCGMTESTKGRNAIREALRKKNIHLGVSEFIKTLIEKEENMEEKRKEEERREAEKQKEQEKYRKELNIKNSKEVVILSIPEYKFLVPLNGGISSNIEEILKQMGIEDFTVPLDKNMKKQEQLRVEQEYREIIKQICEKSMSISLKYKTFEQICLEVELTKKYSALKIKMLLSEFVNRFAKKQNVSNRISAKDFIEDLKSAIT